MICSLFGANDVTRVGVDRVVKCGDEGGKSKDVGDAGIGIVAAVLVFGFSLPERVWIDRTGCDRART